MKKIMDQKLPFRSSSLPGVRPQHSINGIPEPQEHLSLSSTLLFVWKFTVIMGPSRYESELTTVGKTIRTARNASIFSHPDMWAK
jgi:hypothetical protein